MTIPQILPVLKTDQIATIRSVELPALERHEKSPFLSSYGLIEPSRIVDCQVSPLKRHGKHVMQVQCDCGPAGLFLLTRVDAELNLLTNVFGIAKSQKFVVDGVTLKLVGNVSWIKHPSLTADAWSPDRIRNSWSGGLILRKEAPGIGGFRPPQIGALHALAAHSTLGEREALVVMPTGTGKTEVMLAHCVMSSPKRLLVLVPTDALRSQTVDKFTGLGVLHKFDIVTKSVRRPVVGVITKGFRSDADLVPVNACNVVVSTVAMLDTVPFSLKKKFLEEFDTVYFDEAHHLRASSWESVYDLLKVQQIVAFTATPYREDGKRIRLGIVYNFPLKLAQDQNYFRKIDFLEVDIGDRDDADVEIARLSVERLRRDDANGHRHVVLARADDRNRAQDLYNRVYARSYPDLNPVLIFSGIKSRKEILRRILSGEHRIVVCVDMFGEGFDMPSLKIAAMHDVHRSLGITLQFTGRFTRDAHGVGDATLVANVAEPRVSEAIEELYAEDPDWNALIPQLSAKAVQTQLNFSEFLRNMPQGHGEGEKTLFDLNIIRPKTSTVVFRSRSFNWKKFKETFAGKRATTLHRYWPSTDQNMLVFVTRTRTSIEWARIHETQDEVWDLFVLAHDPQTQLLFIHSSQKGTLHTELAKAVGGDDTRIIDGETPFKVLHGINRLVLHSVGLYGKGKLRFRMLTGLNIEEAISAATQSASTKSNIFGAGHAAGKRVTMGASAKGRIWSMSSSTIPDWFEWCKEVGGKLLDPNLRSNALLNHTLVPTALRAAPNGEVFAMIAPEDWLDSSSDLGKLSVGNVRHELWEAAFEFGDRTRDGKVEFSMLVAGLDALVFRATWGPDEAQFGIEQIAGPTATIRVSNATRGLVDYLRETPPVFLMIDGSEVRGGRHLKSPSNLPFTYPKELIVVKDWGTTPITQESKWKHGVARAESVQGAIINQCVTQNNLIVFDDDDRGESADVVEISETDGAVFVKLYHCKYSSGDDPGVRVKDLYEVCGQAVRSARLGENLTELLRHLEQRERHRLNGRPTRFEKGNLKALVSLRRRARKLRSRFEFNVVQPGLSKAQLPAREATILGAADVFLRETTGAGLTVVASA